MRTLYKRRLLSSTILVVILLVVFLVSSQLRNALIEPAYFTGWLMFVIMLMLLLFNLRKKISFLPLGSAYMWAQLHIYGGVLMLVISLMHIDYSFPNGALESGLSVIFFLVTFSGIYGIYISRKLPVKMAQQTDCVIFERIPGIRERIREEVELRVNDAVGDVKSVAIADFYSQHLYNYLSQPADFWLHLVNTEHVYSKWKNRFKALRLYLNDAELTLLTEIEELTKRKIDLDSQYACRSLLKYWLFFHIPLSYILFITVIFHLFLVRSFSWSGA